MKANQQQANLTKLTGLVLREKASFDGRLIAAKYAKTVSNGSGIGRGRTVADYLDELARVGLIHSRGGAYRVVSSLPKQRSGRK